jgi:signal recognition particle subunit SRP72
LPWLLQVELGVLTAQSAFVDQTLGDLPSAEKAYQTLFAFKADLDPAVTAVAANNVLRIRGQRDLFDSWKRCKATLSESLAKKLTPAQRLAFLSNGALLSLALSQPDQCKELLATISGEFPSSDFPGLVKAALQLRAKQTKKCEEALETAASSASSPAAALLTLAQLQLSQKEPAKALVTLERIEALRGTPGMVGTLVALRERLGDIEGAAACFDGATDPALLRAGARFFAKHGRWPQAAKAHQTCLEANPRDLRALAGLVIASSHYDPAAANEHYSRLEVLCPPPDETDAAMVDAAELEQAALPRTLRSVGASEAAAERQKRQASDEADADGSGGGRLRKKRQRRKKPIYPKGFDPENPSAFPAPDPERWLPKRERSTYRQRKKDKRAGISRGPQGSATGAARVDARATTNMQVLSEAEKAKKKADEEAASRAQAAAEAAAANSARKKGKGKGKAKW